MTEDMWGTGDYRAVAEKVTSIGDVLVARADDRARHGGARRRLRDRQRCDSGSETRGAGVPASTFRRV